MASLEALPEGLLAQWAWPRLDLPGARGLPTTCRALSAIVDLKKFAVPNTVRVARAPSSPARCSCVAPFSRRAGGEPEETLRGGGGRGRGRGAPARQRRRRRVRATPHRQHPADLGSLQGPHRVRQDPAGRGRQDRRHEHGAPPRALSALPPARERPGGPARARPRRERRPLTRAAPVCPRRTATPR